jgi:hypothetical protein
LYSSTGGRRSPLYPQTNATYSSVHLPIRRQPTSTPYPVWLTGTGTLYPFPLDGGGFGWGEGTHWSANRNKFFAKPILSWEKNPG